MRVMRVAVSFVVALSLLSQGSFELLGENAALAPATSATDVSPTLYSSLREALHKLGVTPEESNEVIIPTLYPQIQAVWRLYHRITSQEGIASHVDFGTQFEKELKPLLEGFNEKLEEKNIPYQYLLGLFVIPPREGVRVPRIVLMLVDIKGTFEKDFDDLSVVFEPENARVTTEGYYRSCHVTEEEALKEMCLTVGILPATRKAKPVLSIMPLELLRLQAEKIVGILETELESYPILKSSHLGALRSLIQLKEAVFVEYPPSQDKEFPMAIISGEKIYLDQALVPVWEAAQKEEDLEVKEELFFVFFSLVFFDLAAMHTSGHVKAVRQKIPLEGGKREERIIRFQRTDLSNELIQVHRYLIAKKMNLPYPDRVLVRCSEESAKYSLRHQVAAFFKVLEAGLEKIEANPYVATPGLAYFVAKMAGTLRLVSGSVENPCALSRFVMELLDKKHSELSARTTRNAILFSLPLQWPSKLYKACEEEGVSLEVIKPIAERLFAVTEKEWEVRYKNRELLWARGKEVLDTHKVLRENLVPFFKYSALEVMTPGVNRWIETLVGKVLRQAEWEQEMWKKEGAQGTSSRGPDVKELFEVAALYHHNRLAALALNPEEVFYDSAGQDDYFISRDFNGYLKSYHSPQVVEDMNAYLRIYYRSLDIFNLEGIEKVKPQLIKEAIQRDLEQTLPILKTYPFASQLAWNLFVILKEKAREASDPVGVQECEKAMEKLWETISQLRDQKISDPLTYILFLIDKGEKEKAEQILEKHQGFELLKALLFLKKGDKKSAFQCLRQYFSQYQTYSISIEISLNHILFMTKLKRELSELFREYLEGLELTSESLPPELDGMLYFLYFFSNTHTFKSL